MNMTGWNDLNERDEYSKWLDWEIKETKSYPIMNYASALCFAMAAIVHAVGPVV